MSTQQHSTQVEHTKSEQSKHISNSDKNTTENISDQQPHESHEQSANDTQNKIVDFLKEHWIKILIAIALILILVLVKAILLNLFKSNIQIKHIHKIRSTQQL